jgi:outer membrane protein TolC
MRSMAREAAASVAVARRGRHPRAMVGLGAQNYSGSGEFRQAMVELSFTIPWFNSGKYRAEIRREEDRRAAAEFDVADMELAVREETRALVVASEAARREARIYQEEIIPRSEQALASAESAWMTGKGMFLEVLEARRMLLDARLNLARAVADQYEALSELVLCCGLADLEALEMLGAEAPPGALSDLEREARPAAQISSGGPSPNSVPSTPSRTPAQP